MIEMETQRYRLNGLTPILGSQPASEAVRTIYIGSKCPDPAKASDEAMLLPEDLDAKGLTVFMRAPDTGALCLIDYMILGFLKEAMTALSAQSGVKAVRSKVDRFVFARPRIIPILRDGLPLIDEDEQLERSLRADTMQGPRTALTASEMVYDPWSVEFELVLLKNDGTAKSNKITWENLENALDYGALHGLGQWRNGGYGRFTWERIGGN